MTRKGMTRKGETFQYILMFGMMTLFMSATAFQTWVKFLPGEVIGSYSTIFYGTWIIFFMVVIIWWIYDYMQAFKIAGYSVIQATISINNNDVINVPIKYGARKQMKELDGYNELIQLVEPIGVQVVDYYPNAYPKQPSAIHDYNFNSAIIQTQKPFDDSLDFDQAYIEHKGHQIHHPHVAYGQFTLAGMVKDSVAVLKHLPGMKLDASKVGIEIMKVATHFEVDVLVDAVIREMTFNSMDIHALTENFVSMVASHDEEIAKLTPSIKNDVVRFAYLKLKLNLKEDQIPAIQEDHPMTMNELADLCDGYFKAWDKQTKNNDPMSKI
jgi:hypothetical protein